MKSTYSGSQHMPVHDIALFFFVLGFVVCLGLVLVISGKSRISPPAPNYTVKG